MSDDNNKSCEKTPLLLPSNSNGSESSKYYFLKSVGGDTIADGSSSQWGGGTSELVRDEDGGPEYETLPHGATEEEFAPRIIGSPVKRTRKDSTKSAVGPKSSATAKSKTTKSSASSGSDPLGSYGSDAGNFFSNLFSFGEEGRRRKLANAERYQIKPRKVPVKVEPKVFFANERTFLAWIQLATILAAASIAILGFARGQNKYSQVYGIMLLPVAIAFIVYALYQYHHRTFMIRNRLPGPYGDTTGPAVLGIMLMISITAQFFLKLYSIWNL